MIPTIAFLVLAQPRPTDLTFVRHGETVANATGKYNSRTLNVFSKKGQEGVDVVTKKLEAEPRFDIILVSPSPRALRTIAPYLRDMHQRATICPLLYECCTGRRPKNAKAKPYKIGAAITIPSDIGPYFIILRGQDRLPYAPDYESGLGQVEAFVSQFRTQYSHRRVLLVGHSGQGGQFLHALTGKWRKVENAKEIKVTLP